MVLNKEIREKVKYSDWLAPKYCEYLHLEECRYVYELIERIAVNTAGQLGVKWQIMWDSSPDDGEVFINLVITAILIDKYLLELFKYPQNDREKVLGIKLTNILHEYYNSN